MHPLSARTMFKQKKVEWGGEGSANSIHAESREKEREIEKAHANVIICTVLYNKTESDRELSVVGNVGKMSAPTTTRRVRVTPGKNFYKYHS